MKRRTKLGSNGVDCVIKHTEIQTGTENKPVVGNSVFTGSSRNLVKGFL